MQRHGVRRFKEKKCKSAPMYGIRKGKPFNSPFYVCCEGEGGGGKGELDLFKQAVGTLRVTILNKSNIKHNSTHFFRSVLL
jgi:hypothetical protein